MFDSLDRKAMIATVVFLFVNLLLFIIFGANWFFYELLTTLILFCIFFFGIAAYMTFYMIFETIDDWRRK